MEFGTREILVALGMLVLVAILLDGIRRIRQGRKGKLRMSKRRQPIFEDDDFDDYGSELPSGGARVVGYRDEERAAKVRQSIQESQAKGIKVTTPFREKPDQARLALDEPIPALKGARPTSGNGRIEEDPPVAAPEEPPELSAERDTDANGRGGNGSARIERAAKPEAEAPKQPEEVIVLHIMARNGEKFQGEELLDVLLKNQLRYGSMKIFHRHAKEDGSGPILFSIANAVKPGTFDLNAMDQFSTPGISFFITLNDLDEPVDAFTAMVDTLSSIADELNGELKDGNRSALTRQTIEHYRQRVMEFARRRLSVSS